MFGSELLILRDLIQVEIEGFETDVRCFFEIAEQLEISVIVVSLAMWVGGEQLLLPYASWHILMSCGSR